MTNPGLDQWLANTAWNPSYWEMVEREAMRLNSDGCTDVLDLFVWTCREHDIHYRTHCFIGAGAITFEQANYIFRVRIQQTKTSWHPMTWIKYPDSWIRWAAVTLLGKKAWKENNK